MAEGPRTLKEAPTLELVLRRNRVERLKREKSPLSMLGGKLPALIVGDVAQVGAALSVVVVSAGATALEASA